MRIMPRIARARAISRPMTRSLGGRDAIGGEVNADHMNRATRATQPSIAKPRVKRLLTCAGLERDEKPGANRGGNHALARPRFIRVNSLPLLHRLAAALFMIAGGFAVAADAPK